MKSATNASTDATPGRATGRRRHRQRGRSPQGAREQRQCGQPHQEGVGRRPVERPTRPRAPRCVRMSASRSRSGTSRRCSAAKGYPVSASTPTVRITRRSVGGPRGSSRTVLPMPGSPRRTSAPLSPVPRQRHRSRVEARRPCSRHIGSMAVGRGSGDRAVAGSRRLRDAPDPRGRTRNETMAPQHRPPPKGRP